MDPESKRESCGLIRYHKSLENVITLGCPGADHQRQLAFLIGPHKIPVILRQPTKIPTAGFLRLLPQSPGHPVLTVLDAPQIPHSFQPSQRHNKIPKIAHRLPLTPAIKSLRLRLKAQQIQKPRTTPHPQPNDRRSHRHRRNPHVVQSTLRR